ncbi:thermonuclease family protein [Nitrospira sp. NS4]|uniref:thermonuclease family protein n=1 Tax=Nitrospira sp. NS4 TaxID=3414498 RepID=UPI003C2BF658
MGQWHFKNLTPDLTHGLKNRTLVTKEIEEFGRTIADVFVPDDTNVNHTLIKESWSWWYRKYAPEDTVLEGFENEAGAAVA